MSDRRIQLLENGHAYGTAKFHTKREALLGDEIMQGEPVRKVTLRYADGTERTGYIANRTMAQFRFYGDHPAKASVYLGNPADIIEQLPVGTTLYTIRRNTREWNCEGCFGGDGHSAYVGKWVGLGWGGSKRSTKKLVSDLRRNANIIGFVVQDKTFRDNMPDTVALPVPGAPEAAPAAPTLPQAPQGELEAVMMELREAVGFLRSDRDRDFAGSLLAYYTRTGKLSPKQWPHAKRLADKAMQAAPRGFGQHVIGNL